MYFVIHNKCGILHHIHETSIVSWSKTSSRLRPIAYFPFSFRLSPPFSLQLYQQSFFSVSLLFCGAISPNSMQSKSMVCLTTLNDHFHQYRVGIDPPSVVSTTHPTLLTVLTLLHCFVAGRGPPITMPLKSAKIGCTGALPIILLHDSSN